MNQYNVPEVLSLGASADYDEANPGDFAHTAFSVATASLADFGVSVYNSLNLGNWMGDDADTYELLNGMGMDNIADKYLENKDLVQAISFIGGAFVPGGLAIKASRAARSGLSATNYLNPKAIGTNTDKLQELIRDGKRATQEYKKLRFKTIGQGVAQGAVDNVAVELAVIGSMNEHPWMEDYMEDIPASMALSLGLGTAVGSVIDYASTAYKVRNAAASAVRDVEKPVLDIEAGTKFQAADPVTKAHEVKRSLDRIEQILGSDEMRQGTKDFAARRKTALEGELGRTVREMADKLGEPLADLEAPAMLSKLDDMLTRPEFLGTADIKFYKHDPKADVPTAPTFLDRAKQMTSKIVDKGLGRQKVEEPGVEAVYSSRLGLFVHPTEASAITGAADVTDLRAIRQEAARKNWLVPREGELELLTADTGTVEASILRDAVSLSPENFSWATQSPLIHSTDIGGMQGAANAYRKLVAEREALLAKAATGATDEVQAEIARLNTTIENFKVKVPKPGMSTKKALSKTNQDIIKGADIEEAADKATASSIRMLARQGTAPESIALKTNTQLDYVHSIIGGADTAEASALGTSAKMDRAAMYNYHLVDDTVLADAFSPDKRLLRLADNGRLPSYNGYLNLIEGRANQDMLDQWNNTFIRETLNFSEAEGHKELMRRLGLHTPEAEADVNAMVQLVKDDLGLINDELGRMRAIQSADFHARNMGDAGIIINQLGDTFVRTANSVNERFQKMANGPLRNIAKDQEQLLGINTIIQALRAQQGKVVYREGQFMLQKGMRQLKDGTQMPVLEPIKWQGKEIKVPKTWKDVDQLIRVWEKRGKELHAMRTTEAKALGQAAPSDVGLWIPPVDTRGKIVHFAAKTGEDGAVSYSVVTGKTKEEVEDKARILRERYGDRISIITPSERDDMEKRIYDKVKQQLFEGTIREADTLQTRRGYGAEELFDTSLEPLRGIEEGFTSRTFAHMQRSQSLIFHDLLSALDVMEQTAVTQSAGANLSPMKKFLTEGVSNAKVMKSQLLGSNDLLSNYTPWKNANDAFEGAIELAMHKFSTWSKSVTLVDSKKKVDAANIKWEELEKGMEKAGLPFPFKGLEAINAERGFAVPTTDIKGRRVVAAANNFASLFALRFAEIAHPLVNMLSQPILTTSAIRGGNRSRFMGKALVEGKTSIFETQATMMQGVAAMNNPAYKSLMDRAESTGVLDPIVSEASAVIRAANINEPGMIAKAERGLEKLERLFPVGKDGKGAFVAFSDGSEVLSRRAAFATGIVDGMKKYGMEIGVDDTALYIYAKDFMDRAIGNYIPHQRPAAFQGTLGAAVGLFQTYMLTMAQDLYRHLEVRDFKALGATMMWQGSLFGIPSMPGMAQLSTLIGTQFSSDHVDMKTGLFRMTDSKSLQDAAVYGLPSALGSFIGLEGGGPNIASRGAVDVRFGMPGAEMVYGAGEAAMRVVNSMRQAGMETGAVALAEALSQQSVSRPLARSMELITGHSVNLAGRTVAVENDVWQSGSILARLMGVRPTDEVRMREAAHLNSFYGSYDRDKRKTAIEDLRQHIRYGSLDNDAISRAADKYFGNNGSPQGFRSALSTAIQMDSQNLGGQLRQDVDWNSPLMDMIGDL